MERRFYNQKEGNMDDIKSKLISKTLTGLMAAATFTVLGVYHINVSDLKGEIAEQQELIDHQSREIIKSKYELKVMGEKLSIKNDELEERKDKVHRLEVKLQNSEKQLEIVNRKINDNTVKSQRKMPSRGSESGRRINVVATAYTARCEGCTGITTAGVNVRSTTKFEGKTVIAVDPNVIPLHSLLRIDVNGQVIYGIAMDTGGAIKGGRIDIIMGNHNEAMNFGIQSATVTVLREGKGV